MVLFYYRCQWGSFFFESIQYFFLSAMSHFFLYVFFMEKIAKENILRIFETYQNVPTNTAILKHFWDTLKPNDIVMALDDQAEIIGAPFASLYTSNKTQKHRKFSNLVTLTTLKVSSSTNWLICCLTDLLLVIRNDLCSRFSKVQSHKV